MVRRAARAVVRAARAAPPGAVLAAGWALAFIYAYPGQMREASFAALRQARTRFASDAYAPAYSALWRQLERLLAGPSALLVVQTLALVLGAHALLRRVVSPRAAAWLTAALVASPPVIATIGVIAPSALSAGLLAVGAAAQLSDRPRAQLGGLAALLVATAVQPIAAAATLPLVGAWFVARPGLAGARRYLAAAAAWLAITAAALGINAALHRRPTNPDEPRPAAIGAGDVLWLTARHPETAVLARELPADALKHGVPTRSSELQDAWTAALAAIARDTPLFFPWLYAAAALAVLWLARRHRDALALAASGLALEAAVVVTATSTELVQSLWLIVATALGSAIALARRARG